MAKPVRILVLGDATSAKSALKETESALGQLNTKMVAVGSAIGNILADVAEKIVGLGLDAAKALPALGDQFHQSFASIRVGTGQTGAALDELKGSFETVFQNTPAPMEQVSDAVTKVYQRLNLTGDSLELVTGRMITLARITGSDVPASVDSLTAVFSDWNLTADEATAELDLMLRAFQKSGVPIAKLGDDIAGSGAQMKQLGFTLDQTIALSALLGKSGLALTDVMMPLSKAITEGAKAGKSASVTLGEFFQKVRSAPTDTQAAAIAIDMLGERAGRKLAPLVRDGKLSYDEFLTSIRSSGDTISAAGADAAGLGGKWEMFVHKLQVAVEPLATEVFRVLTSAMQSLSDWWAVHGEEVKKQFTEWANQLSEWWKKNGPDVINGIKDIVSFMGDMIKKLVDLKHWMDQNGITFQNFKTGIGEVQDKVQTGKSILDELPQNFQNIGHAIVDATGGIDKWIQRWQSLIDVFNAFKAVGSFVKDDIIDPLVGSMQKLVDLVGSLSNNEIIKRFTGGSPFGQGDQAGEDPGTAIRKAIFGFDTGGTVPGYRGQPQLVMAHGGETILPTHKRTFTINNHFNGWGMAETQAYSASQERRVYSMLAA